MQLEKYVVVIYSPLLLHVLRIVINEHTQHENHDRLNPIIVLCQFPGVSDAWCVYESELEFAEEPISVDTSSLL